MTQTKTTPQAMGATRPARSIGMMTPPPISAALQAALYAQSATSRSLLPGIEVETSRTQAASPKPQPAKKTRGRGSATRDKLAPAPRVVAQAPVGWSQPPPHLRRRLPAENGLSPFRQSRSRNQAVRSGNSLADAGRCVDTARTVTA